MPKQFEVCWEGTLPGTPEQAWDAFTAHTDGWLWKIRYEPRVGGAETGLTAVGGVVTAWEPYRRFITTAGDGEGAAQSFNQLDYQLEPRGADHTHLTYTHRGVLADDEYDHVLDACRHHTPFYYHSLTEYLRRFPGRDAVYVAVDAPDASKHGGFAVLREALGVPENAAVGDEITVRPAGMDPVAGVVDYATDPFLGVRTSNALYRFFGRDRWGWPVGVAMHLYGDNVDKAATTKAWEGYLNNIFSEELVK